MGGFSHPCICRCVGADSQAIGNARPPSQYALAKYCRASGEYTVTSSSPVSSEVHSCETFNPSPPPSPYWVVTRATVRADGQADAQALVEKAIKAAGGADNLAKLKAGTLQIKGKFYGMGDGIDYTATASLAKPPDKQHFVIEGEAGGQKFTVAQIFNKDKGWAGVNGKFTEMDKDQIEETKEEIHAGQVARLSPAVLKASPNWNRSGRLVNDKPALGVRVEVKGIRGISLFFDKETHQLVKTEPPRQGCHERRRRVCAPRRTTTTTRKSTGSRWRTKSRSNATVKNTSRARSPSSSQPTRSTMRSSPSHEMKSQLNTGRR